MRRPPPPHRRGQPKAPGSGRRRGTPNRRTVEMRQLMTSLCDDVDYQDRHEHTKERDVKQTTGHGVAPVPNRAPRLSPSQNWVEEQPGFGGNQTHASRARAEKRETGQNKLVDPTP
jgi:hypothetical protein